MGAFSACQLTMMGAAFMIDGGAAYELPSTLDLAAAARVLVL